MILIILIFQVPVIDHFLDDIQQHKLFSGFCVLGVKWQPIEAEQMRRYFQLAPDNTGVLVANVLKLSCGHDIVKKGDILMSIDGCEIADNGTVMFFELITLHVFVMKTRNLRQY